MAATINPGITPLIIKVGDWLTIAASTTAVGSLSVPTQGINTTITGGTTVQLGGYTTATEVVVNLTQGSLAVTFSPTTTESNVTPASIAVAGFGDSITAYWNHFVTPTAMSRTAGVASVTSTAHGLGTSSLIRVFGVTSDPSFHTANGVVTRVDANTFTYPSPGPDVTSVTVDTTYTRVLFKGWYSNVSAFLYANSRLKGALTQTDNFGRSSETTTQMLARVGEVAGCAADVIVYLGGANDAAGSDTAATTIANDAAIVRTLVAAGKTVVLCTIMPLGTGHASFATATPKIIQINAAKRALVLSYKGRVRLCDYYAALVNSATGGAKTNALQSDAIHPQTYGARLMGVELAAALTGIPEGRFLTTSIADARSQYSTSPSIWHVGQFTQTDAGAKSGPTNAASPPAGSVAGVLDGYNVTATAGAGEVWMVPDDDGYGYGQVCSWTPSGAGTVTIQQESAATMAALVTAGDVYRVGFHLKVSGVTSALTFLRCRIQGVFDGTTMIIGTPMHSDVGAASNVFTTFDEYIVGPEMTIPPFTACTSLTLEVIANFSGATTIHTITVSRMTFSKVR